MFSFQKRRKGGLVSNPLNILDEVLARLKKKVMASCIVSYELHTEMLLCTDKAFRQEDFNTGAGKGCDQPCNEGGS